MRIILLKDVRGVGQHGEIKDVADGYAINRLFPGKLAEPATEEKIRQVEHLKKQREEETRRQDEVLDRKVQSLHGKKLMLSVRATEKGGLFKAITSKDVVKAILGQYSLEIPEAAVRIPQAIKTIGEHAVTLQSKNEKAELSLGLTPGV